MLSNFPHRTQAELDRARHLINRMGAATNGIELNTALREFLNSTRFCFQDLVTTHTGRLEGFDNWWMDAGLRMKQDVLCIFFRDMRNKVIKSGTVVVNTQFGIKVPSKIEGPLTLGYEGIMQYTTDEKGVLRAVPYEGDEVSGFHWEFGNKPREFINTPSSEMLRQYLTFLDGIKGEFLAQFVHIPGGGR